MGADNWTICPKCKIRIEAEAKKLKLNAGAAYGKVSSEAYLALLETANAPVKIENTLRENYDIGMSQSGLFNVSYSCSCSQCNYRFSYEHEEKPES